MYKVPLTVDLPVDGIKSTLTCPANVPSSLLSASSQPSSPSVMSPPPVPPPQPSSPGSGRRFTPEKSFVLVMSCVYKQTADSKLVCKQTADEGWEQSADLVTGEKEDDVALLVLDGHDVQQTPERAGMLPAEASSHFNFVRNGIRSIIIQEAGFYLGN